VRANAMFGRRARPDTCGATPSLPKLQTSNRCNAANSANYLPEVKALRPSKRMHSLYMRVRKHIDLSREAC